MNTKLICGFLSVALAVSCSKGGGAKSQEQYETVQEGSAAGVTSTIHGPGETLPPITGTNADTTTAFALDANGLPTTTTTNLTPNTMAGTLPSQQPVPMTTPVPGARPAMMPPPNPVPGQQPQPVTPEPVRPAPQPQPPVTQPPEMAPPTDTAEPEDPPATDTSTTTQPPPTQTAPPPAEKKPPAEEKPPTDTSGTQEPEPPPPPPPVARLLGS